jgi:homoserine O-acetyltransferase/O-succinyltransferase
MVDNTTAANGGSLHPYGQYNPSSSLPTSWTYMLCGRGHRPRNPQTMRMTEYVQERTQSQPENPFSALIPDQQIAIIPEFTLESGATLYNVPVAYTVRGKLSPSGDNAMVICHALTGSADVSDWWGPLLGGPGRSFDTSRFFIVCMNSLGSPYGTASPVTAKDGDREKGCYGPEFPLTTIRDDVR